MPSVFNGKRFFLTYPRCDKLPHELVSFLQSKGDVAYYIVAREKHQDGTPHLHACVEFVQRLKGGTRLLDFEGHHPNKQDPNNWAACKNYCKKDGDYVEGPEEEIVREALSGLAPSQIVQTYDQKTEWFDYCIKRKISFQYAEWYWNQNRPDEFTLDVESESNVQGTICESLASMSFDRNRHRVIIIRGKSGCGKTTWAKKHAPKPALFVSHIDSLKKFDSNKHKSIIFDDVDFSHYPRTAQIHLVDFDNSRAIHVRYGVVEIPAGIFKIFTCNTDPVALNDEAIRRRVKVYNVV